MMQTNVVKSACLLLPMIWSGCFSGPEIVTGADARIGDRVLVHRSFEEVERVVPEAVAAAGLDFVGWYDEQPNVKRGLGFLGMGWGGDGQHSRVTLMRLAQDCTEVRVYNALRGGGILTENPIWTMRNILLNVLILSTSPAATPTQRQRRDAALQPGGRR